MLLLYSICSTFTPRGRQLNVQRVPVSSRWSLPCQAPGTRPRPHPPPGTRRVHSQQRQLVRSAAMGFCFTWRIIHKIRSWREFTSLGRTEKKIGKPPQQKSHGRKNDGAHVRINPLLLLFGPVPNICAPLNRLFFWSGGSRRATSVAVCCAGK